MATTDEHRLYASAYSIVSGEHDVFGSCIRTAVRPSVRPLTPIPRE